MVDSVEDDGALVTCPTCGGAGFTLRSCPCRETDAVAGDCTSCEGMGQIGRACVTCEKSGMVYAQVVVTVVNVDLATVASTQIVPGAQAPTPATGGGWEIDCDAIATGLLDQVSAAQPSPVDRLGTIVLPREYRPGLPAEERHHMETIAIAHAACESRWRVRHAHAATLSPAAPETHYIHLTDRAPHRDGGRLACRCVAGAPPRVHCDDCLETVTTDDPAISYTEPGGRFTPHAATGIASGHSLDHLAQLALGLGLGVDIGCANRPGGSPAEVCQLWELSFTAVDQPSRRTVGPVHRHFREAIAVARRHLDRPAGTEAYPAADPMPVPQQKLPPAAGLSRVEVELAALTRRHAQSGDAMVQCRVERDECRIYLWSGDQRELLAAGPNFETAAIEVVR